MRKLILFAVIVFLSVSLIGCFVSPHSFTQGRPIADNKVRTIEKGKTTKDEIISWFGVPTTIIKKGDKTKTELTSPTAPSPTVALPYFVQGVQGTPTGEVSSEQLFSLFSSKKIKENDVIYYYAYTTSKGSTVGLLFFSTSDSHAVTDKLLILIDEESGIVKDFILSKES